MAGRGWFGGVDSGVTLVRTDGEGAEHKVKSGDEMITVTGTAGELIMIALRSAAEVEVTGDDEAVARFRQARLHVDEEDLFPEEE